MDKIHFMHKPTPESRTPPLADQALSRLRRDVMTGVFPAEAKLKIEELQTAYGLSSSPLREALSRLTQEGLIRADERRGFRVPAISAEDLADITHLRLMLDVPALRDAIAHGDDIWEASVVAAFHRLERTESKLSDGPVILDQAWSTLHRDFHQALLSACPSARQLALSASLFDQAERYRHFSARHRKTVKHKSKEHRRLVDAALKRDADTACALLADHIRSTQKNVLDALASVGN